MEKPRMMNSLPLQWRSLKMNKTCPFTLEKPCDEACPLFISPEELNEFVTAKLSSIGVLDRNYGECSLKMIALSQSRMVFEKTNTRG